MNRTVATKPFAAVLTAATAVTLASCVGAEPQADDSVVIFSRLPSGTAEGAVQQSVVDAFTEETGIEVEIIEGGADIDDQVETAVAAGQAPDLVIVNLFDKTIDWLDQGVTVPADQYIADWGLTDRLDEEALTQWRSGQQPDGELQGIPYTGFTWPIWYNADLLESAGIDEVPTTTDALIEAASALRDAGTPPMIVGGRDFSGQKLFYQIIQSYTDADQFQAAMADGSYCDVPSIRQGVELFTELRDAGVFVDDVQGFSADDMSNTYFAGGAAMMPAGSWSYRAAAESGSDIVDSTVLGGLPAPTDGALGGPSMYVGFTGAGFMITETGAAEGRIEHVERLVSGFFEDQAIEDYVAATNSQTPIEGDFAQASENGLYQQANTLAGEANTAVLPDLWIGSAADPITQQTALAFGDATADTICSGIATAAQN